MTSDSGGVRPAVAVALATIGYVALLIAGLGMTSLLLGAEVIAVPGLGQMPGVLGTLFSTVAVGAVLWGALRRTPVGYGSAGIVTVAALLAYLAGIWLGAVFSGADPARATATAAGFAVSWFAVVLAVAAFAAGWTGVALVRTRADRPRWPWEDPYDE